PRRQAVGSAREPEAVLGMARPADALRHREARVHQARPRRGHHLRRRLARDDAQAGQPVGRVRARDVRGGGAAAQGAPGKHRAGRHEPHEIVSDAAPKPTGRVARERIRMLAFERLPAATLDAFAALSDLTGTVSDALDNLGLAGAIAASELAPNLTTARVVGQAVT